MIREIIVVEGRADISAVKRAVEAELIATDGFCFGAKVLERIREAQARRGVIILTDPDNAGESIRRRIMTAVPGCKHARIARKSCDRRGNIGIENASPEDIQEALKRAHVELIEAREEFDARDMMRYGLTGCAMAKERRRALGDALHLGYANARQLLQRLNHYNITRQEVERVLSALKED